MEPADMLKRSTMVIKLSVFVLICLGALLLVTSLFSSSIALTVSGVDTLGDAFVSSIVFVGLTFAQRPADEVHQFGYYKIENLSSMVVAVVLVVVGGGLVFLSYQSFMSPQRLGDPVLALTMSLVSSGIFFVLFRYKSKLASQLDSLSLKTDARNTLTSALSTLVVFFALAFSYVGAFRADAIGGMVLALLTFYICYVAIRESSLVLIDGCACSGARGNLRDIASGVDGVRKVHEILLRKSGPYIMGEMHIKTDGGLTVYEADQITKKIEKLAKEELPVLKRLTIKVEPVEEKA